MIKVTGSKVHRLWKCPPSIVLPQIETTEVHPLANRGRDVHAYLDEVPKIGVDAALIRAPEDLRPFLMLLDLDALPLGVATEVAFLYDWRARRAREIGRSIGRDYVGHLERTGQAPIGPTEIAATIDLFGAGTLAEGIRAYVGDYKTGRSKLPAPDQYGQTMLAALCARSVLTANGEAFHDCVVELIYIREDGESYPARRNVDDWDLDTFADELAASFELADYSEAEFLAGRGVPVREGPHCAYCPAYKQCPAKIALVRALPRELGALGITREVLAGAEPAPGTIAAGGAIPRERASEIWMAIERMTDILGRIKQEITGLAAFGDIDLPDGRVIGLKTWTRETLDGAKAAALIEQWFGAGARDKAIKISVSKDALATSVTDHVAAEKARGVPAKELVIQSKKGTGILDRITEELRRRGGIDSTTTTEVKPHVPRRKALKP